MEHGGQQAKGPSDQVLAKAMAGDRACLIDLLEELAPALRIRLESKIPPALRVAVEADDVLQVTYIEVFGRIGQFKGGGLDGFKAWVGRVAENNLLDAIRAAQAAKRPDPAKRAHRARTAEDSAATLIDVIAGDSKATPSRFMARGEAVVAMERMLATLPADYARVIRLYDLAGHSADDVAREMGRTTGAIFMLRARAHDRLREAMGDEGKYFSRAGG
ncbi:MAG: sigma-70 family RNA polymerase sigma factor [Phycisphaeraceae bacterium]|nr:sigma-70 family RNA polymerase sigma factor [Phycisphaeraceae bacterium]